MCNPEARTLQPEEVSLLRVHDDRPTTNEEFNSVVSLLRKGRFQELFEQPWFASFRVEEPEKCSEVLRTTVGELEDASLRLLTSAAVFLGYFIQQNFVGPTRDDTATGNIFPRSKEVASLLNLDGEDAYHLVRAPAALYMARVILVDLADLIELASVHVWRQRYAIVHQQVLPEKVDSLHSIVIESTSRLEHGGVFGGDLQLWTEQRIETALANLEFFQVATTERLLSEVSEKLGVTAELGGALGTRTHFQTTSIAQLMLKVQRTTQSTGDGQVGSSVEPSALSASENDLPKDIALRDDTVMDKIKFDQEQDNGTLSSSEIALVLAISLLRKRLNAPEELLDEEVMAYLNCLLSQPRLWSVQFSALFQRSMLECSKSRKVERALSQYQSILDAVLKEEPVFGDRSRMFFVARIPTTWRLETDLANAYISLGLTKSALDVYLRLELWEEVIECYRRLQRNDRGEAIVRKLLQDEQTPHLYCLLGDVTGDPDNYRIALELANGSHARARRSWGYYHFQRKEYEEAIPHLKASLELNRLHYRAWQQLAFCYMSTDRFEECVQAYKRVVTIEADNFEAWNNMAKAYISLGDKAKAFRVLQESLKCNYEDWRIWENYLLVSMDVGAFAEVVKSWHRLIDIKQKHVDDKIARLLLQVIEKDIKDIDGNSAVAYLRPKLFELFGRASSTVTNDAGLWTAYGDLYCASEPREGTTWSEHVQKMTSCYQKGLRCFMQKNGWEKDTELTCQTLELCQKVWSLLDTFGTRLSTEEKRRLEGSLEMSIRNALTLVKRSLDYHSEQKRNVVLAKMEQLERAINA